MLKILLAALSLIIIAVAGYHFIAFEKEAYSIRKEWAREREEGMKKQAERMGRDTEARKVQRP